VRTSSGHAALAAKDLFCCPSCTILRSPSSDYRGFAQSRSKAVCEKRLRVRKCPPERSILKSHHPTTKRSRQPPCTPPHGPKRPVMSQIAAPRRGTPFQTSIECHLVSAPQSSGVPMQSKEPAYASKIPRHRCHSPHRNAFAADPGACRRSADRGRRLQRNHDQLHRRTSGRRQQV